MLDVETGIGPVLRLDERMVSRKIELCIVFPQCVCSLAPSIGMAAIRCQHFFMLELRKVPWHNLGRVNEEETR